MPLGGLFIVIDYTQKLPGNGTPAARLPAGKSRKTGLLVTEKQPTSIAIGWSEPVPGRELHPRKSGAFHGALFQQFRKCPIPYSPMAWKDPMPRAPRFPCRPVQ
jgi:hypothetical protein